MSGRDLRMFITSHRAEEMGNLSLRMKGGQAGATYKPVCYEQLRATLEEKRLVSAQIDRKIQRTVYVAQMTRQSTRLRLHRQVWAGEQARLTQAGEKAEKELQSFLRQHRADADFPPQILDLELLLEKDRESFRGATVEPVWQLREDLQCRLSEGGPIASSPSSQTPQWDLILQQVQLVKEQQIAIGEKLHSACLSVEQELVQMKIEERHFPAPETANNITQVPEEIVLSGCPYPDLRAALLHEFQSLSEKYSARLQSVRSRLGDMDSCCGWPAEEHLVFQMTVSQYPHSLTNHRALYMDMLQRLLPHRSRQELSDHERRWVWYHFSMAQQRAVLQSWRRDRVDLLAKTLVTLAEAQAAHQEELVTRGDRAHQQEVCTRLREKLQQWREQQEEVARLEAAIAARRHEEEEEKMRKERERETTRRTTQKEKVRQHHAEKQKRREEMERRDQRLLEQLRALMNEQARKDRERVQFREGIQLQRKELRETQALLRLQEEEERQERLESLRNQVAVFADADPQRMMGDTEAWKSHHRTGEREFILQEPLYRLHTYTDTQIVSDPRIRIEQALREAGLHNTLYAKEVLSVIPPPRPPRRDTESSAFKHGAGFNPNTNPYPGAGTGSRTVL